MNRPASKTFRAHDSRRDSRRRAEAAGSSLGNAEQSAVQPRPTPDPQRTAAIERQLAAALEALARQQQESEENATSFAQLMARLAHSERTLGQTKTKLMAAEERVEKSEARVASFSQQLSQVEARVREQRTTFERDAQEERERFVCLSNERSAELKALRDLAESLSRDSAAGTAECARLNEQWRAAEEREQAALQRALDAESNQLSSLTELSESKRREGDLTERCAQLERARDLALASLASLQATLTEREAEHARDQRELASADQERAGFIGILAAIEALGREITDVGFHARTAAETRSKIKAEEADADRTTLRPEPAPKLVPRSLRSSTAPEITVDGVRLDS
jgi:chromosome segregation ATPase